MGIFDFFKKEPILFKNITNEELNKKNNENPFVAKIRKKFGDWDEKELIELANYINPSKKWKSASVFIDNDDSFIYIYGPENQIITIWEDEYDNKNVCIEYKIEDEKNHYFTEFLGISQDKIDEISRYVFKSKLYSFIKFLEREKQLIDILLEDKLKEFDIDNNGIVDVIQEDVLTKLLKEHQKKIIEIDRTYIQQFVKASSYIDDKKKNIQMIFEILKKSENVNKLEEYINILKNEIHTFNLLLINALGMITALVEDDMITFYQIHDSFDKLGVFNSNWENEVSQKLSNIGDKLDGLMFSIQDMSYKIVKEIGNLSYVTQELNNSMSKQLSQINSSINLNTLMTGIQTYQMYKINKNTKQLRG